MLTLVPVAHHVLLRQALPLALVCSLAVAIALPVEADPFDEAEDVASGQAVSIPDDPEEEAFDEPEGRDDIGAGESPWDDPQGMDPDSAVPALGDEASSGPSEACCPDLGPFDGAQDQSSTLDVGPPALHFGLWALDPSTGLRTGVGPFAALGQKALARINDERAAGGLPALEVNEQLSRAAVQHSRDMARQGLMSHTGRDGSTPVQRAALEGYQGRALGEVVAVGYAEADQVVAAWMRSPEHRRVLLAPGYSEFGIGLAEHHDGAFFWTVGLGRPWG